MIHRTLDEEEILIAVASYVSNTDPELEYMSENAEITCRFSKDKKGKVKIDVYVIDPPSDKSTMH